MFLMSNIQNFRSVCCGAYLSIEPLCRICGGVCGEDLQNGEWYYFPEDPSNLRLEKHGAADAEEKKIEKVVDTWV